METDWLRLREGAVDVRVRLSPRAPREGVQGRYGDRIKIRLTAAPVAGAANEALRRFLARAAGVAAGKVSIVVGQRSRSKIVRIDCEEPERVGKRLRASLGD